MKFIIIIAIFFIVDLLKTAPEMGSKAVPFLVLKFISDMIFILVSLKLIIVCDSIFSTIAIVILTVVLSQELTAKLKNKLMKK